jgi:hypothetical protein
MSRTVSKTAVAEILVSTLLVAVMVFVQHQVVPERLETALRSFASMMGLLAVPVLILFTSRAWANVIRAELSTWRNGLSLGCVVVLSGGWLFCTSRLAIGLISPELLSALHAEWTAILLDSSLAAALLAIALRGTARIHGVAAAFLMWAWLQAGIYV